MLFDDFIKEKPWTDDRDRIWVNLSKGFVQLTMRNRSLPSCRHILGHRHGLRLPNLQRVRDGGTDLRSVCQPELIVRERIAGLV